MKKILLGFPIGIAVLMVTYVLIGVVEGSQVYTEEIMKLTDYKFLLTQCCLAGVFYIAVAFTIDFYKELYKNLIIRAAEKKYHTWKEMWLFLIKYIAAFVVLIAISYALTEVIDMKGTLRGYTGEIFYGITAVVLVLVMIGAATYNTIEARKIRKALKKKQEGEEQE